MNLSERGAKARVRTIGRPLCLTEVRRSVFVLRMLLIRATTLPLGATMLQVGRAETRNPQLTLLVIATRFSVESKNPES